MTIQKFDPSKLFQDPAYFRMKARLEQIAKSEVMTPEEQIATYRDIIKEAKEENKKLKEELDLLKKRLAPPPTAAPPAGAPVAP